MNQVKKKTLVPLIVFLLGICLVCLIVYKTDTYEKEQRHITAQLNATTYGERIKKELTAGIEITNALKQILISENGEIHQFNTIAENLISDSVESVQLAPNGVVTDIYPAEGNEAGKIDLIHDKDRGEISCYARDNHTIITQGPFELKQGGYGIAVRNPVYLENTKGQEYFWGFTTVILRVPDIFSDAIHALSNFGYEYRILKTETPLSGTYKVVYQSDGQINHPVSYAFTIGDESWKFEVTPKSGWSDNTLLTIVSGMFLTISLLLSVLTRVWLIAKEHKNIYQILARTDSLTNIYNRYGFDEFAEKMISKNPQTHFVAALFDIDDFKFINDIYGHGYGDRALKSLADHKYGGSLPVHCHFIMDEFANVSLPDDFDKILSVMRSRGVSVSIILQNLAQLKALFEKQWESIVGNCDTFLYLGGNEQSTHKYVSELLGKETIDTNTYGKSEGRSGSYSTNYQISGRELMTPDEVRMLDNRYALLFLRGERPVMDFKYDIMKHPNVKLTTDGGKPPYIHGEPVQAVATLVFDSDIPKNAVSVKAVSTSYELLSNEDLEEISSD